jgi:hypothetical protein
VPYHVKIFFYDKLNDKVVDIIEKKLEPDCMMPMPDCLDPYMQSKAKIAIRPSKCRKWSQEFKLDAMKKKIREDVNTEWPHFETYSVLRKVQPNKKLIDVFDFILNPPMIVKNCLPCPISLELTQSNTEKLKIAAPENANF